MVEQVTKVSLNISDMFKDYLVKNPKLVNHALSAVKVEQNDKKEFIVIVEFTKKLEA